MGPGGNFETQGMTVYEAGLYSTLLCSEIEAEMATSMLNENPNYDEQFLREFEKYPIKYAGKVWEGTGLG